MALTIAERIEAERVKHDWSYEELAEALGVSKSQAHDWANGAHEPTLASLRKIADALNIPFAKFVA